MTDDASDAALAVAIAAIAADFDAAMPARVADLREALGRAATGDATEVTALVDGLHRLAGNAGTFGHAGVSARARDLEVRLAAALAAPDATEGPDDGEPGDREPVPEILSDVGAFLDDLAAAFPAPAAG